MLQTSSSVYAFGVATLVLVILLCLAGIFCVAYVLYFRSKIHQAHLCALREFNSLWIVQIALILFAILWGLMELLRLPLLKSQGWPFYSLDFGRQANLCKVYTISSLGILEPCFFLTTLFLVQGSVTDAPLTPRKKWNGKVMALIVMFCIPVFLLQVFVVVMSSRGQFGLPSYFTRTFIKEVVQDGQDGVAVCTFPLFSTLVLALFGCIYNIQFLCLGRRMMAVVINRRLQMRIGGLVLVLALLVPMHASFIGLSVLSSPGDSLYETFAFLGFLTVLLCISVGQGILVVQPISDALAVRWVFDSLPRRRHSGDDITMDPSAVPLSVFGTEENYSKLETRESLLVKTAARESVKRGEKAYSRDLFLKAVSKDTRFNSRDKGLISSKQDRINYM